MMLVISTGMRGLWTMDIGGSLVSSDKDVNSVLLLVMWDEAPDLISKYF